MTALQMRRLSLALAALVAAPVLAAEPGPIAELSVFPTSLKLQGVRDARHVLVTGKLADGKTVDLTTKAQLAIEGPAAVLDAERYVTPKAVGQATLKVSYGDKSVNVPVEVTEATPQAVSFIRDVIPVMSKVGCNQGTCHGAQAGKAGFKLSLRGYDPEYDYNALVDDLSGRRFNRSQPAQSLMLLKPTQGVPHEGGFLFDEDSRYYAILQQWIAEGCELDAATRAVKLEVFPPQPLLGRAGETVSHIAIAHFDDGSTRDVTRDATFDSSNFECATVNKAGDVEAIRRGETNIIVRYEGLVQTNVVTVLGNRDGFAWTPSPEFNFVDTLVNQKLQRMQINPAGLCTDAEFLRRISIDLTGVPPTSEEVRTFLADARESQAKRLAKIDELLASPGYLDHWTLKWSDLLLSNRKFITEKGIWTFRHWIRSSLESNLAYDKFVYELMTANGSTFENPAANYYRISREPKIVMENMTQLFIGTRFMCAQCHDHPFERWTQNQYYELSAFFSGIARKPGALPGEEVIYSRLNSQPVLHPKSNLPVAAKFPYTFGDLPATELDPREQLAAWLTSKENPYFAESLANRYWSYFLGRGIIDPVDDIRSSNPPSNGPLLEALTKHFIDSGFDLKGLIRTIVSSHTYQRSIVTDRWNQDDSINYSHASPRRLGAEQLYDAIMVATGAPTNIPGVPAGFRATQLPDNKIDLSFLDMFGRPPRESPCECERTSEVSLTQALNLINGETIGNAVAHPQGLVARLVAANTPANKLVEEIYLAVLGRLPTAEEQQKGEQYLTEVGQPLEGGQDLMWALINSPAFLFNR